MTTFAYSKSIRRAVAAALVLAGVAAAVGGLATAAHARPMLEIAPGGRHLQTSEGEPFFYLGDTAWALFHRLTREEAEIYLRDRADKEEERMRVLTRNLVDEFGRVKETCMDGLDGK